MFFSTSDDDHRRNIGYCYEIVPPSHHASRDDNPPFMLPARQSTLGELFEYHKNNGSLAWFLSTMERD